MLPTLVALNRSLLITYKNMLSRKLIVQPKMAKIIVTVAMRMVIQLKVHVIITIIVVLKNSKQIKSDCIIILTTQVQLGIKKVY